MASIPNTNQRIEFNTTVWAAGAVMALFGSMLIAVGMALGGFAFLSAARKAVKRLDTPPTETARTVFRQLQAAASAGTHAWQSGANSGEDSANGEGNGANRNLSALSDAGVDPRR